MPSTSPDAPAADLPVQLAKAGDGLRRWVRLRMLWDRLARGAAGQEAELAELGRLLDGALPEAARHADALAAVFETHAAAINRHLGSRSDKAGLSEAARRRLAALGPDFAASGATLARAFVAASAAEQQFVQAQSAALARRQPVSDVRAGDPFCAALSLYIMEEDVNCISGDAFACAVGDRLTELGIEFGCL